MNRKPLAVFWYRRDLRLDDNAGLYHALKSGLEVLPLFIFDSDILDKLEDEADARVSFIHQSLLHLSEQLKPYHSQIFTRFGSVITVWEDLFDNYAIKKVFCNHDYEPSAILRDKKVKDLCIAKGAEFYSYKDQCIFEKNEVTKDDGLPYTVFTPYSKKWLAKLNTFYLKSYPTERYFNSFYKFETPILSLEQIGFTKTNIQFPEDSVTDTIISQYSIHRDLPYLRGTSRLSVHLRFGTISIRKLARQAQKISNTYLNELIWRDFYMMILYHFPQVVEHSFKPQYDMIEWQNDVELFEKWCKGLTGYPIVDAGMRELNTTGFMHNRVRMITASFLTKHLLIDWRWGEAYFAQKLLDFDLSANNGGWQWAASSGCDAAPYFRVFNPTLQMQKFDPNMEYVKKWVPEFGTQMYPKPIIDHDFARKRVLSVYKKALEQSN